MVAVALGPQFLPLFRAVLLHHHGTQERCYEQHRKYTRDSVGIPVQCPSGQQLLHEGQYEGEHHGNGG